MTRIAASTLASTLLQSMQAGQANLARAQEQLATGRKASDLAELGRNAPPVLSARSTQAREAAYGEAATMVSHSLSLYDARLGELSAMAGTLKQAMQTIIGTGQSAGFQEQVEGAFAQLRSILNSSDRGIFLFGGMRSDAPPFAPDALADLAGPAAPDADAAFADHGARASARVADGIDMAYGLGAGEVGADLFALFRTLADAGPFGQTIDAAQAEALEQAVTQAGDALSTLGTINAGNGQRRAEIERLTDRAAERGLMLGRMIGQHEDADLAKVASDISRYRTMLEASYATFRQVSELSLTRYLG